jgi:hypothetical protein
LPQSAESEIGDQWEKRSWAVPAVETDEDEDTGSQKDAD